MAWEWLAPTGTVVGAMITAGLGGFIGGRKTQERQHKFERESSILERGCERADEAIAALRFLRRHPQRLVVKSLDLSQQDPLVERAQDEFDHLGRAVEYLTDATVREQVDTVHQLIGHAHMLARFWNDLPNSEALIGRVCNEGVTILGRYLRHEPAQALSDELQRWKKALDDAWEEIDRRGDPLRRVKKQGDAQP